jgi:hypothetical protein
MGRQGIHTEFWDSNLFKTWMGDKKFIENFGGQSCSEIWMGRQNF